MVLNVSPGDTIKVSFTLTNTGGPADNFIVNIVILDISGSGFGININTGAIASNQSKNLNGDIPLPLNLPLGTYSVKIRVYHASQEYPISEMVAGQIEVISAGTRLICRSSPTGASVYLDGNYAGVTEVTIMTTPGMHLIRFEKTGYYPYEDYFEVEEGITNIYDASLVIIPPPGAINPTDDSYVEKQYPTTNNGNERYLRVRYDGDGGYRRNIAYLKFNLSSISGPIRQARLYLYCIKAGGGNHDLGVYPVSNDSWTEGGITYNNRPGWGSLLSSLTIPEYQENKYYIWDVTSFVNEQLSGDKIVSLAVLSRYMHDYAYSTFHSKENDNKPYLELKW